MLHMELPSVTDKKTRSKVLDSVKNTLEIEATSLITAKNRLKDDIADLVLLLHKINTDGKIVVTGIGKSGHIGSKMAATFASTGSPAIFVHSTEASHGDLGMIKPHDVVIAISQSGENDDIIALIPAIHGIGVPVVAMTGRLNSRLGKAANFVLDTSINREACPLNLAPTASTTLCMALGDAIAVALMILRGFNKEQFAATHPGGALGRRLLTRVRDVLSVDREPPTVLSKQSVAAGLQAIAEGMVGLVIVLDAETQKVVGVYSDGDLRRSILNKIDIHKTPISEVMTKSYVAANSEDMAAEAFAKMRDSKISAIPVFDGDDRLVGVLSMAELLNLGLSS